MANQEHLDIILKQGVEVWNQWRNEHADIRPDLSNAYLAGVQLQKANLSGANLTFAILVATDLSNANLSGADLLLASLTLANLSNTNLSNTNLSNASLCFADLHNANLSNASLKLADLHNANLSGADLLLANLSMANLSGADLHNTNLNQVQVGLTIFGAVNLNVARGLETVQHQAPSTIGIDTIYASKGNIPEVFLKGAGIPETFLINLHTLVDSMSLIDFYSCFISYSSKDQAFAQRLHADLQSKGVRCWFAPHDMKIGDKIRSRIDESIRLYDKLLVVLSEHSINSAWVENEVMTALEKEQHQNKLVLFPVKLDETVMHTSSPWAANMRRTRHMGDFSSWKDHDTYQKAFTRLLRDLKAEAQKREARDAIT